MNDLPDPGWYANIYLHETPGQEQACLYVIKISDSDQFVDLKQGKANIIIAKKLKGRLKYIHTFHGSEVKSESISNQLTFVFPKKFFTYFKTTGIVQGEYITAIYTDGVDQTDFLDLMKYFHSKNLCQQ